MVEGPGVHRVAVAHRRLLLGRAFEATSPNGRFADGAAAVNGYFMTHIEAHGKNIFYFFTPQKVEEERVLEKVGDDAVVVHIHFGMAGSFRTYPLPGPEPREATRLKLRNEEAGVVAHLSASLCVCGDIELYRKRILELGPDPLREDADKEKVWVSMQKTKRSIGALLMDQSIIAGIGNIYRSELLFVVGVHPDQPSRTVTRTSFEALWDQAVRLMHVAVLTGFIVTILPEDAGNPLPKKRGGRGGYVYNQKACGKCGGAITTWTMAQRTVFACEDCQPPPPTSVMVTEKVAVRRSKVAVVPSADAVPTGDSSFEEMDIASLKKALRTKVANGGRVVEHQAFKHISTGGLPEAFIMPGEQRKPHEIVNKEEVQVPRRRKLARKAVTLQTDISEEKFRESSVKSRTRQKNIGDDQYEELQMLESNLVKNENSLESPEVRRSTRVRKQELWESVQPTVTRSSVRTLSTAPIIAVMSSSAFRHNSRPSTSSRITAYSCSKVSLICSLRLLGRPLHHARPLIGQSVVLSSAIFDRVIFGWGRQFI